MELFAVISGVLSGFQTLPRKQTALLQAYSSSVCLLSFCTNATLIAILLTSKSADIGRYRYLLLSFACTDIWISLQHLLCVPVFQICSYPNSKNLFFQGIYLSDFGFVLICFSTVRCSEPLGLTVVLSFGLSFYQPFILLGYHFVYRYVVACKLVRPESVKNDLRL